jgi:hypothetical protein
MPAHSLLSQHNSICENAIKVTARIEVNYSIDLLGDREVGAFAQTSPRQAKIAGVERMPADSSLLPDRGISETLYGWAGV